MQSDKEECRACIGFDEKHTCEDWSKFQIMEAEKDRCPNCTRLQARVEELEGGINRAGALALQKANHELIRQILDETIAATEQGEKE